MNIFYLDSKPSQAAIYHHDKHVVKMILETAQLLSTVHRFTHGKQYTTLSKNDRKIKRWGHENDKLDLVLYKSTHVNHPSCVWARHNINNYNWLCELGLELCKEYTYRYKKKHKTEDILRVLFKYKPSLPDKEFTDPTPAMNDEFKLNDSLNSYRNYYVKTKIDNAVWTKRSKPFWLKDYQ